MDIERIAQAAPLVVRADTPLLTAINELQREGLQRAPVVDEEHRLVGELRGPWQKMRLFDSASRARQLRVANAMKWDTLTICSNASLLAAQERMRARCATDAYVVSRELRLVGIITLQAIEAALAFSGGCGAQCAADCDGSHAHCRGRWCRHASICADAILEAPSADTAPQGATQ